MSQDRHGIYPLSLGALNLTMIHDVDVKPGSTKDIVIVGGNVDPSAAILNFADPTVTVQTEDLSNALTTILISAGLNVAAGGTIRFQKRTDGGTFAGITSHITLSSAKGFVYPVSLNASQDQEGGATLELEYKPLWDGTLSLGIPVAPLTINASQTISGVVPTYGARFFLGPVYKGAAQLEAVKAVRINSGIEFTTFRGDGELYARQGSIISRKPTIEVDILKVDYASTIAHMFNADQTDSFAFYFAKGVHGGARVAYTTAVHIKITAATGAWSPTSIKVTKQDDAMMTIKFDVTGTLAQNLVSAIP